MSLRARLLLIALLAGVALAAAALAIVGLAERSDVLRETAARRDAGAASAALARAVAARGPGMVADPAARAGLRAEGEQLLATLVDGHGGYCTPALAISIPSRGPRGETRRGDLPPDQREAVEAACARARAGTRTPVRIVHPHDVVLAEVVGVGDRSGAWALVRVSTHPEEDRVPWPLLVVVMAAATLGLVLLAVDSILALRRGVGQLEDGIVHLGSDLGTTIAMPRAGELARLATLIRAMAAHLAETQARERNLAAQLAHEDRLASLGRVVAGVAHEVRNPLTGIKLKLDGMAARPIDDRSIRDVQVCLGEVERLDSLVQTLLLVARKPTGEPPLLDLGELVDARIALLGADPASKGVAIERTGEAGVAAPREAMVHVVDNLLRNAIEASEAGETVRVAIGIRSDEVFVAVEDAGAGVAVERTAELFEPFFTTKPDGTGLGLWVSRALVRAAGGELAYEREDDRTRFVVTLPAGPDRGAKK